MAEELTPPLTAPSAGAADEEVAARALATRYRLEYVDVGSFAPDPEILKSVPVDLMSVSYTHLTLPTIYSV